MEEELSAFWPKWKFHAGGMSKIVQNQQEEVLLGLDWYDHPSLIPNGLPSTEDLDAVAEEDVITVSTDGPVTLEPKKRGRPKKVE